MNIGFTYDLRDDHLARGMSREEAAEFDKQETIDAIADMLAILGHQVDRIGGITALVARLAGGDRWDLVFNIAEGVHGAGREAQIPALLEAYGIPVTFGDSLCLAVCLHKGHAKHIVAGLGLPTPRFIVIADADAEAGVVALDYPLFVKPAAEGTGKGVAAKSLVKTPWELREVSKDLLRRYRQPVLVEEYLPGREFTVGVCGTGPAARVAGVMEVSLRDNAEPGAYSYDNKDNYLERVDYRLVGDAEAMEAGRVALACYRALGCRDAGRVDLRSDASGNPQFIEVNPLAGLNPVDSDLPILCRLAGIGYDDLIAGIVDSAAERIGVEAGKK